MPLATIPKDAPPDLVLEENEETMSRLEANPLTQSLASAFADFQANIWSSANNQHLSLRYNLKLAKRREIQVDAVLNTLVKKLSAALILTSGSDQSALYLEYFGDERPYQVAAGILGPQVTKMERWLDPLSKSPHKQLSDIGQEIDAAIVEAGKATKARIDAEQAIITFETTGELAKMNDRYNALRKLTYGQLGQLRHQHPELPNDFADSFFRHETRKGSDRLNDDQLRDKIASLRAHADELQVKLDARLAKAAEEAAAEAQRQQQLAAIEAKRKEREALDAEIKAMEGQVGK